MNKIRGRLAGIYDALKKKLGREPTHKELLTASMGSTAFALTIMGYTLLAVGAGLAAIFGGILLASKWMKLTKPAQKVCAVILSLGFIFLGVGLVEHLSTTDDGIVPEPDHYTAYHVTMAAGSCYDFGDWATDGDCAAGAEVDITNRGEECDADATGPCTASAGKFTILVAWAMGGGGGSTPDSFAISIAAKRVDEGWINPGTSTPADVNLEATVDSMSEWKVEDANGTNEIVRIIERNTDGIPAIAWTDSGSVTQLGSYGGVMNLYSTGESATFILSSYLNEDFTNLPTGSYYRDATITLSDAYGTSITIDVTIDITVT